ncbi:unnamed protein product [Euphydryas editha]|uniref:Uncharacterized protein n=1 Tax=Euphydryas editha TaxID=104508 RepID=A0AAU9U2Z9_EUPED|nr:unnamed protein product [Euphydryas editha]
MFKFVVLCAFIAAATATPGFITPLRHTSYSNILAPATTVISSYPNNLVYSSPYISLASLAYSTPLSYQHLIKKRSALLNNYIAPSTYVAPSAYIESAPLATTYTAAAPLATTYTAVAPFTTTYAQHIYSNAPHLIKKRSAPLIVPSSYVAPYFTATRFVPSTYVAAGSYVSSPVISSAPFVYNPHFIKKRSALYPVSAYAAPTSFSHTSRFDYRATSPAITYTSYAGAAPLAYSPLSYNAVSRLF